MPDMTERSTADDDFAEWLLSDHPWAHAERERRRAATAEFYSRNTAAVREWVAATRAKDAAGDLADRPPGWRDNLVALAESMTAVADENAAAAAIDDAAPDEVWVHIEREKLERNRRNAGHRDYVYPVHLVGPSAAAYPPPL